MRNDSITVTKQSEDCLRKKEWLFAVEGVQFILNRYEECTRQTKRHGWQTVKFYRRLDSRSYYPDKVLTLEDVPMNEGIRQEVCKSFIERAALFSDYHNTPLKDNDLEVMP